MPPSLEARRHAIVGALRADALEARVAALSQALADAHTRLAAVENMLLEATWESPSASAVRPAESDAEEPAEDERVAVPKLELDNGGMSRVAAQALFGH